MLAKIVLGILAKTLKIGLRMNAKRRSAQRLALVLAMSRNQKR
jgi:hypothetical protein